MPKSVHMFGYRRDQAGHSAEHWDKFWGFFLISRSKQACSKWYLFLVITTHIFIDFVQWKLKLFVTD